MQSLQKNKDEMLYKSAISYELDEILSTLKGSSIKQMFRPVPSTDDESDTAYGVYEVFESYHRIEDFGIAFVTKDNNCFVIDSTEQNNIDIRICQDQIALPLIENNSKYCELIDINDPKYSKWANIVNREILSFKIHEVLFTTIHMIDYSKEYSYSPQMIELNFEGGESVYLGNLEISKSDAKGNIKEYYFGDGGMLIFFDKESMYKQNMQKHSKSFKPKLWKRLKYKFFR